MKMKNPTSKRRTLNAVGSDALVRLDLLRNGKPISPLEAVNQLLCRKNIQGVSACEIMEGVRAAGGRPLVFASSPDLGATWEQIELPVDTNVGRDLPFVSSVGAGARPSCSIRAHRSATGGGAGDATRIAAFPG